MASTSTNKQPMMLDRAASNSTLVRTQTGQTFATSLLPTSIGNVTKVFDVDQALTDTQISGAYIDEIFIRYTKDVNRVIDSVTATTATYTRAAAVLTVTLANHNFKVGQKLFFDVQAGGAPTEEVTVTAVTGANTFTANSSASGTITSNNVNIQKKFVKLGNKIKTTGDYSVDIDLHPEVNCSLDIEILSPKTST